MTLMKLGLPNSSSQPEILNLVNFNIVLYEVAKYGQHDLLNSVKRKKRRDIRALFQAINLKTFWRPTDRSFKEKLAFDSAPLESLFGVLKNLKPTCERNFMQNINKHSFRIKFPLNSHKLFKIITKLS